jgi:hypothetical protein
MPGAPHIRGFRMCGIRSRSSYGAPTHSKSRNEWDTRTSIDFRLGLRRHARKSP